MSISLANVTVANFETLYAYNVDVTGTAAQFEAFDLMRYEVNNLFGGPVRLTLAAAGTLTWRTSFWA